LSGGGGKGGKGERDRSERVCMRRGRGYLSDWKGIRGLTGKHWVCCVADDNELRLCPGRDGAAVEKRPALDISCFAALQVSKSARNRAEFEPSETYFRTARIEG